MASEAGEGGIGMPRMRAAAQRLRPRARMCGAAMATRHPWLRQKPSASPWPQQEPAFSFAATSLQVAAGPQGPLRRPQQEQERRKSVELSGTGFCSSCLAPASFEATRRHLLSNARNECTGQLTTERIRRMQGPSAKGGLLLAEEHVSCHCVGLRRMPRWRRSST